MVSGGKETLSFEFIRILLAEQRAHAVAARFASSVPVKGFKYGAAADGCDNPSRVWVEQLPLEDLLALRRPGQPWWRRCTPFTWALSVVAAALQLATIPTPNVLEVAWLLLYEARGTCPHLCFRTH